MAIGLVGRKCGMSRVFLESGESVPVSVIEVEANRVTQVKTQDTDGYDAIQVTTGAKRAALVNKPQAGHFAKAKVEPKQKIAEFRVDKDALLEVGAELSADHFVTGQFVDVTGTTIGKGFAGGMKRWNFGGLRATHGVSVSHRSLGSTGQRQDPGRTFKGKKMAGHMGDERVTTQNLKVVGTDPALGIVMVKGNVPGHEGSYVLIKDAVKRPLPKDAPFPAALKGKAEAAE